MIVTLAFEPFEFVTDTLGISLFEFEIMVTFGVVPEAVIVIVVLRRPFKLIAFRSGQFVVNAANPLASDDEDHDDEDE